MHGRCFRDTRKVFSCCMEEVFMMHARCFHVFEPHQAFAWNTKSLVCPFDLLHMYTHWGGGEGVVTWVTGKKNHSLNQVLKNQRLNTHARTHAHTHTHTHTYSM